MFLLARRQFTFRVLNPLDIVLDMIRFQIFRFVHQNPCFTGRVSGRALRRSLAFVVVM